MSKQFRAVPSRAVVYRASAPQTRLIRNRYARGGVPNGIVAKHLLLRGEVDVPRLRAALVALVRRHPILRTNYALFDDDVVAIVHDDEGHDVFTVVDRSGLSDEVEIREHVVGAFHELSENFLAPDRHSILQAVLIPHHEGVNSLVVAIDHVAIDERARTILQHELGLIYAGKHDDLGEVHPFDASAMRRDFPSVEESPAIRDLLTPLPPRFLASPDPEDPEAFRSVSAKGSLDREITEGIGRVARALRCTRYAIHMAAMMWTLKLYSESDDIGVVTPMDTRSQSKDFLTVGYFQNQVLLRSRSSRSAGIGETVRECVAAVREAYGRRDYPLASLVAHAAARREGELGRNALFQVMVVYSTEDADSNWVLNGTEVQAIEIERTEAANELRVYVTEHSEKTEIDLVGAAGIFTPADLQRMIALWQHSEGAVVCQADETG